MRDDKQILLVAQKNAGQDDPGTDDIYRVGTVSSVLQLLKLPDGTVKVLVEGNARAEINSFIDNPKFFQAHANLLPEVDSDPRELEALARAVVSQFEQYVKLNKKVPPGGPGLAEPDRRSGQARRYGRRAPVAQDLGQAGAAGDQLSGRPARAALRLHGERDQRAPGGEADPLARQAPDGEDATGVLPQRADEGDPEGARRARGRARRGIRAGGAHPQDQAVQGGAREGARRGQEAAQHEPDVGRGDRGAQLPRLDAVDPLEEALQDQQGPQARRSRFWTRITSAWRRSRSAYSSTSRCSSGSTR